MAFAGIAKGDTQADADYLAAKLPFLRLFPDREGKMNRSALESKADLLIVPNFTIYAATHKGNRPSFDLAERPEAARVLFEYFVTALRETGLVVESGVFQAHMRVLVENDGPVTLLCESPARKVTA